MAKAEQEDIPYSALSPEQRAQARHGMKRFEGMSPEQRRQARAQRFREHIGGLLARGAGIGQRPALQPGADDRIPVHGACAEVGKALVKVGEAHGAAC